MHKPNTSEVLMPSNFYLGLTNSSTPLHYAPFTFSLLLHKQNVRHAWILSIVNRLDSEKWPFCSRIEPDLHEGHGG